MLQDYHFIQSSFFLKSSSPVSYRIMAAESPLKETEVGPFHFPSNHPLQRISADKGQSTLILTLGSKLAKAKIEGSCACGTTEWSSPSLPTMASFCHCTVCQKISGGSFIAFMDLPLRDVLWIGAKAPTKPNQTPLKMMSMSKNAERGFCRECGSTLTMRYVCFFTRLRDCEIEIRYEGED